VIPDIADQSCVRSTNNYPNLVAAKLKLALTDVSCGAATTDNIISTPQGAHPLQIDAVTPDTATTCPPSVPIAAADLRYIVDYGNQLHTIIKQSAAAAKVAFIESYNPKGHDACAAPAERWV
jgi:hypothetical protein